MTMLGVLKQMDEEKKNDLLAELAKPRFSDGEISPEAREQALLKMKLKRKGLGSLLNQVLHRGDEEDTFKHFKIGR